MTISVQGVEVGEQTFEGAAAVRREVLFEAAALAPFAMNRIVLAIPAAQATPDDRRRLGLALVRLEIGPAGGTAGAGETRESGPAIPRDVPPVAVGGEEIERP